MQNQLIILTKNSLLYRRTFESGFTCTFHLRLYPFDTQRCSVHFVTTTSIGNSSSKSSGVELVPGFLSMALEEQATIVQVWVEKKRIFRK